MRLPDFVGVGAMRGGTTTLWAELRAHPQIFLPERKELHFFDRDFDRVLGVYSASFEPAPEGSVRGEITPSYMIDDLWRRRLHQTLPGAKLIAILRDPVKRAWSHYRYSVRWGPEHLDFRRAIEAEPERIKRDYESRIHFSYGLRGRYVDQLEALAALQGRDRLLVLFLEDLVRNRDETLAELGRFLGLSAPFPSAAAPRQNEGSAFPRSVRLHAWTRRVLKGERGPAILRRVAHLAQKRNLASRAPRLDPAIAAELALHYAPYDARLADFLGRPLPWQPAP